jgi:hypothetical protein
MMPCSPSSSQLAVGAKVTAAQLADTLSLEGTTMPDGQTLRDDDTLNGPTFEDWLKDKEGRKEDVEN